MELFGVFISQSDLILVAVNALVATSLYLTMVAGVFSIGQVAFMAIGAYGFGYSSANLGWPIWVSIAFGGVVAGAVSLVISLPMLRVSGIYLAIVTVALIRIVQLSVTATPSLGGINGLYTPLGTSAIPAWLILAATIGLLGIGSVLPFGKSLRALGEDEELARSLGMYAPAIKIVVFVMGGMVAGLAGAVYGRSLGWIGPDLFNIDRAIQIILFAVVGGFASVVSPALGAAVLTILTVVTRSFGDWQPVAFGLIVLIGVIVRPNGVFTGFSKRVRFVARRLRRAVR